MTVVGGAQVTSWVCTLLIILSTILYPKGMEVQEAVIKFIDEDDTPLPGQVGQSSAIDVSETVIGSNSSSMGNDKGRLTDGRPRYVYCMCIITIPVATLYEDLIQCNYHQGWCYITD